MPPPSVAPHPPTHGATFLYATASVQHSNRHATPPPSPSPSWSFPSPPIPRLLAAVAAPTPHTPTPVSSTPPQCIADRAVLSLLPRDDGGAAADCKAPDVEDAASRATDVVDSNLK
uniref:Uncharacterized protein n=1 Tax=Oryza glumipatula TaxID=40148 RepID=A0A0E0A4B8_9ORYZ